MEVAALRPCGRQATPLSTYLLSAHYLLPKGSDGTVTVTTRWVRGVSICSHGARARPRAVSPCGTCHTMKHVHLVDVLGGRLKPAAKEAARLPERQNAAALKRTQSAPCVGAGSSSILSSPTKVRTWERGHHRAPPASAARMVRRQLTASSAAIKCPSPAPQDLIARENWLDYMDELQQKREATERRQQRSMESEVNTLEAQLDALFLMTSDDAFINRRDRDTLLRLVADMRKLDGSLEKSPLADPVVLHSEQSHEPFRSHTSLDVLASRTLTFAHKRERLHTRTSHRMATPPPQPALSTPPEPAPIRPNASTIIDEYRQHQALRERAVHRRMTSQFHLGLVQKLHTEQQQRVAERAEKHKANATLREAKGPPQHTRYRRPSSRGSFARTPTFVLRRLAQDGGPDGV